MKIKGREKTDQKKKKLKFQETIKSNEIIQFITENANDLIAVVNKNFEYDYVNENAFLSTMGRSKEDLIGKNLLQWIHPDDKTNFINTLRCFREKVQDKIHARFIDASGKYHWFEIKGIERWLHSNQDFLGYAG